MTSFYNNSDVTVVLTSCNRLDLLTKTLKSFFIHNTYPLKNFIIIEDSGCVTKEEIKKCIPKENQVNVSIIINQLPLGQTKSIDKAYQEVDVDYVFHCEDDWLFYRKGFIEESKKILSIDNNIFCVWLRSYYHDLVKYSGSSDIRLGEKIKIDCSTYQRIYSNRNNNQCFTLNPSLRHHKHYPKQGYASWVNDDGALSSLETIASSIYEDKGLYSVLLENSVIKHIGYNRHTRDYTEKWKKYRQRISRVAALILVFLLGLWLG